MIILVCGVVFYKVNFGISDECVRSHYESQTLMVCLSDFGNQLDLNVKSGERIQKLMKYFAEQGLGREISRVNIKLMDNYDFKNMFSGLKDPNTGELLTAYGWEVNSENLVVFLYVSKDYIDIIEEGYINAMIGASVWYFHVGSAYFKDLDSFGPEIYRNFYYNDLSAYEKIVEII